MSARHQQQIFQQCALADRGQLLSLLRQSRSNKQTQQALRKLTGAIADDGRAADPVCPTVEEIVVAVGDHRDGHALGVDAYEARGAARHPLDLSDDEAIGVPGHQVLGTVFACGQTHLGDHRREGADAGEHGGCTGVAAPAERRRAEVGVEGGVVGVAGAAHGGAAGQDVGHGVDHCRRGRKVQSERPGHVQCGGFRAGLQPELPRAAIRRVPEERDPKGGGRGPQDEQERQN